MQTHTVTPYRAYLYMSESEREGERERERKSAGRNISGRRKLKMFTLLDKYNKMSPNDET